MVYGEMIDHESLIEAGIGAIKDWDAPLSRDIVVDIVDAIDAAITTYTPPPNGWTCFHCGVTFIDERKAAKHFGTDPIMCPRKPECQQN